MYSFNIPCHGGRISGLITLLCNVLCGSAVAAVATLLGFGAIIAWETSHYGTLKSIEVNGHTFVALSSGNTGQ